MQSVNARLAERSLPAEFSDEMQLMQSVVRAHMETCDFTREKVQLLMEEAHRQPNYTACPPTLVRFSTSSLISLSQKKNKKFPYTRTHTQEGRGRKGLDKQIASWTNPRITDKSVRSILLTMKPTYRPKLRCNFVLGNVSGSTSGSCAKLMRNTTKRNKRRT